MTYIPSYKIEVKSAGAGLGGKVKNTVTVYDMAEIANMPLDCEGSFLSTGSIIMRPGKYPTVWQIDPSKFDFESNGVGDSGAFEHTITAVHPGNEDEAEEYIINKSGNFINLLVIVEFCSNGKVFAFGNYCQPMHLLAKEKHNKDAHTQTMEFKSAPGKKYTRFIGTQPSITPNMIPVDATSVDISAGSLQYTTNANTVAKVIGAFTGMVDGQVFSIIGGGGAFPPTIISSTSIVLQEGVTWNASNNSYITFKVKKSGTSAWTFIEQARG